MIRRAVIDDLERITAIYNQAVISKQSTADTDIFTTEQREGWFSLNLHEQTPIYVYEREGTVVGYCYLSGYRPGRQALESTSEISYYVDFAHHHKGIGSRLLQYTIEEAKKLGYKNLLAILLSCNQGSIALLQKFGFKQWGCLPNIAHIGNNVYSHLYYGLKLSK